MKTEKIYNEYEEFYSKHTAALEALETEREKKQQEIKECSDQYAQALKEAAEKKAEESFNKKLELDNELKQLNNRIKIKQEMNAVIIQEKRAETLSKVGNLDDLYKSDIEAINSKMKKAADEYNKLIDQLFALNDEFRAEEYKYRTIYEKLSRQERTEAGIAAFAGYNRNNIFTLAEAYQVKPNKKLEKAGH